MKSKSNHCCDTSSALFTLSVISNGAMLRNLMFTLLSLVLMCYHSTDATTVSHSIYRELESKDESSDCRRSIRPAYYFENTADAYQLVVTIPEKVSRKHLKIDVDYNEGHIEVFGWWFEGKIRGEEDQKMCVHGRWALDSDLLSEEAIISSDLVSIYDVFMSMHDQQLILSVPMIIDPKPCGPPLPPPSPIADTVGNENVNHHASVAIAYGTSLWKRLQGLVRLKDHARKYSNNIVTNSTLGAAASPWEVENSLPPSSFAYEKYRQDALNDFLAYAMSTIDEFSNF